MPLLAALENVRRRLAEEAREFCPMLRSEAGWQFARLLEHALDQALAGERARCAQLADLCREAAWEKLHTGNWKDVSLVWRDAYGLSVVLYTLACLPAEQSVDHLPALDLAVIMGSPRFRELVDALIGACQADAAVAERPAKRPRSKAGSGGMPANAEHSTAHGSPRLSTAVCGAWAEPQKEVPLPPGSLSEDLGRRPPTELAPPLEAFLRGYLRPPDGHSRPVIITGAMAHWPALERWRDPGYLDRVAGARTVPVEVGTDYLSSGWGQMLMPLRDFMRQHVQPQEGIPLESSKRGYLAQHTLFDQIPELARDIMEPSYCALGEGELQSVNAWFGPAGTVTPLHHDPHCNLLCQVLGRKYVRLFSPQAADSLYAFADGLTTNSSQFDVDKPDFVRFPLAERLPYVDCIIEPGQMLYIPPRWWHFVKSLTVSFSVTYWWR